MIFTTVIMNIAIFLRVSPNDVNQQHLIALFGPFTRFTVGSLTAYVVSSNVDILLYLGIKKITPEYKNLWIRNNASTLISQVVDNVIFNTIAFVGVYSMPTIISIIFSTYFLKIITSIFDTPFVYVATYWKNKGKINDEIEIG